MENPNKRPVGGAFLAKIERNGNLKRYHKSHPKMTHAMLARIFKISRVRVTQILGKENDGH
jgi:hypothetical protein